MRTHYTIQNLLIVFVLVMNVYCIIDGFQNKSYTGVTLALGSLVALIYCVRLLKKVREANDEEN